jgi:hypothetical protein
MSGHVTPEQPTVKTDKEYQAEYVVDTISDDSLEQAAHEGRETARRLVKEAARELADLRISA